MNHWVILSCFVILAMVGALGAILWLIADPACPKCHQRDWSKGVPPWRCRRCGTAYHPGAAATRGTPTPRR